MKCCPKKDLLSKMLRADMFGRSKKKWKTWRNISALVSSAFGLLILVGLYFFFYGHAYEIEFRFPEESQLSEAPRLRSEDARILHPQLRARVVPFLTEQCSTMEDVDILFCFQLSIDGRPLYSPCFVDCRTKDFYYDLEVMETDDAGSLLCIESFSTLELRKTRPLRVAIRGSKGVDLEEFVSVPSTKIDNCLMQHANDVVRGTWIK